MEQLEKTKNWLSNSITLKLIIVAILTLLLLIPKEMIQSLIHEREVTRDRVVREISSKWGQEQTVTGPVLSLPYYYYQQTDDMVKKRIGYLHVLPEKLDIKGDLIPNIRYRGIYKVIAYNSMLNVSGNFNLLNLSKHNINFDDIVWDDAILSIGIPDMIGINKIIDIKWNDSVYVCEPGITVKDIVKSGVSTKVLLDKENAKKYMFNLNLDINGSEGLFFVPLGKITDVNLQSTWDTPSFDGEFLPDERSISTEGFKARWNILNSNRNYPQSWKGKTYDVNYSKFGVKLLFPVDQYQKSMRSVKYAIMFIALTFIIFFFIEVINKKRVHPVQYLLIGIALCVFYSLLISLAEHLPFVQSYLIASISILLLITFYTYSVLKSVKFSILIATVLLVLYIFLYTILQLMDYSLLLGNIGLFIVLALIMIYSRKIDWYRTGKEE